MNEPSTNTHPALDRVRNDGCGLGDVVRRFARLQFNFQEHEDSRRSYESCRKTADNLGDDHGVSDGRSGQPRQRQQTSLRNRKSILTRTRAETTITTQQFRMTVLRAIGGGRRNTSNIRRRKTSGSRSLWGSNTNRQRPARATDVGARSWWVDGWKQR